MGFENRMDANLRTFFLMYTETSRQANGKWLVLQLRFNEGLSTQVITDLPQCDCGRLSRTLPVNDRKSKCALETLAGLRNRLSPRVVCVALSSGFWPD